MALTTPYLYIDTASNHTTDNEMQNSTLYIEQLRRLLQMEHDSEKEEFRLQSEKMPLDRKKRRGICWHTVSVGRSYYNSLNQLVVEITRDQTTDETEHDSDETGLFEYGKPVRFFSIKGDESIRYFNFPSVISYVDGNRMVCSIPSSQAVVEIDNAESLGVQLYFDETSYRTMFAALADVAASKGKRLSELRDICAGQQSAKRTPVKPISLPWLNMAQGQAVNEVLWARDVAVVHGPPGTGKTTTLVEAIYETLKRETQVMVCAQSNMAVDWIAEKLTDHGIPVLRIGNPSRVNDKMLSFTYERLFADHPDYPELWSIRTKIRQLQKARKRSDNVRHNIERLRDRAAELEISISGDLFRNARVVASTLVGAANKLLVGRQFTTLFIDEAAQALEPACWIAMRRAHRVVLAGDHQQLPPTIKCYEALKQGLGKTLMERIVENQPDSVTFLDTQYRMNDEIMQFSSNWFYEGKLRSDESVRNRGVLDYDQAITWVNSEEPEQYAGEGHSRINKEEAELLLLHLQGYMNKISHRRFIEEGIDVGIISPYRAQTHYIRQRIKQSAEFKDVRHLISINTVDGFQGQERDIILISLVRSNEHGQIGFLSDLRRMNVAMTRARMKLIIFGNRQTLAHSLFYKKLLEYIDRLNLS